MIDQIITVRVPCQRNGPARRLALGRVNFKLGPCLLWAYLEQVDAEVATFRVNDYRNTGYFSFVTPGIKERE